jgi:hypothetical protein
MADDDVLSLSEYELRPSPFADLTVPLGNFGLSDQEGSVGELTIGKLRVRLGNRPIAYDLRRVFMAGHGHPPDTSAYNGYDIWMVVHTMGVLSEDGRGTVEAMGYEVSFPDEKAAYTIDLLPRTEFVTKLEAGFQARVDLGAEGRAGVSTQGPADAGTESALLAGSISVAMSKSASLLGKLSFSLKTPIVQAVGIGSSRSQWHFEKHDKDLFGDQVMVQTVLVPRRTKQLDFKIRGYAMIKPRFYSFAARHETGWVKVSCPLVSRPVGLQGERKL